MNDSLKKSLTLFRIMTKKAKDKGLFHIVISSTLTKIVGMMSAMFLPRIIANKAEYGLLTYVDNIRNYILLFNALGITNATLKYCSYDGDDAKRKGYFISSLLLGIAIDFILIFGSIIYFYIGNFTFTGSQELLLWMSVIPLLTFLFEDIQIFFRACLENKKFSCLSFFYSFCSLIFQISFAYLFHLKGVVIGRYLSLIMAIIVGVWMLKMLPYKRIKSQYPELSELKSLLYFGIVMMAANVTSSIMQLNETLVIGQVLKSEVALADYRVASYILSISLFLVQSLTLFIYPYFVKHCQDKKWVWDKFKKVSILNAIIMIPLHLILIWLTPYIIIILFGSDYLNITFIMRMLLFASLGQSTLRGITGNILAGIGEEKFNLSINILFTFIHFIVDYAAVFYFGLYGAAIALSVVYYLSGIIMIVHLYRICHMEGKNEGTNYQSF